MKINASDCQNYAVQNKMTLEFVCFYLDYFIGHLQHSLFTVRI